MADLVITLPLGASLLVLAALVHAGVSFVAWRRFRRTVDDLSRRIEAELDAPAPENAPARGVDIHTSDGRVLTLSFRSDRTYALANGRRAYPAIFVEIPEERRQ